MSTYRVSLPALQDGVERIAAFDRAVEHALVRIAATAQPLAAGWTGSAAASYAAAQAAWQRDLDALRAAAVRMRRAAATAHGNYAAAVGANQMMWAAP